MLKERNFYKEGLPVNVVVADIQEYPIHFHEDIEVIYVLSGSIVLKDGYYTEVLKQGDIFILNSREMHSIYATEESNMTMMLQLDSEYFSRYYDNLRNSFFVTGTDDDNDEGIEVLRGTLARIMMEILQKGYGYEHKVIESTHNLISCLLSDFQCFLMEDGKFVNEAKNKSNKVLAGRLSRITDYMYENYTRKLTLNEIAEREHLSIYYLSHVIKEATGLSFQDLLSFIRVEESEKLLLGTNKKIGVIAYETGFSAVRYYIKHFETWFGMHPIEYRRKYTGKVISHETSARYRRCSPTEIENALRKQVRGVYSHYISERNPRPVIIDVDLREVTFDSNVDKLDIKFFHSEKAGALRKPYDTFKELGERMIYSDANCAISTGAKNPGNIDSLTILIYNLDDKIKEEIFNVKTPEELGVALRDYDEEVETLIRCSGMNGEYRISRYRISKENFLGAHEERLKKSLSQKPRDVLLNRWMTMPSVNVSDMLVADTLSLRATMKGVCAEIIMVDRKTSL